MPKPIHYIDLSHEVFEGMPEWPGKCPFHAKILESHDEMGILVTAYDATGGCSTHMDAPIHFVKDGRSISDFALEELLTPAVVVRVQSKVAMNPDYVVSPEDIRAWEAQYGRLPPGALVIADTGWYLRWPDPVRFFNWDEAGGMHYPGFSAAAAEYLLERKIAGIGIDTISIDCGVARDFPAHRVILGADKFAVEMLANLGALPDTGAYVLTLPMKLRGAPEAQARVVGFVV